VDAGDRASAISRVEFAKYGGDMKRIAVAVHGNDISAQARTYAELRLFSTLSQHAPEFQHAAAVLREARDAGVGEAFECVVTVTLESAGTLRVRAAAAHVYAAINDAVERLADVLGAAATEERRFG
jgi:ribosome-associated translation inhibitor RaiA